jgi:flagellar FliJ protein
MEQVLPLLIEQATGARDRQSARLAQVRQSVQQAQATLERLQAFRLECLARSPAAQLGRGDGAMLAGYQQFLGRLDDAIAMQRQEAALRQAQADQQQALLAQCQQKLLAFQTLAARQAQRRELRAARKSQRESDEFAARAYARGQERTA